MAAKKDKKTKARRSRRFMRMTQASSGEIFHHIKDQLDMGGHQHILKSYPEYDSAIFEGETLAEEEQTLDDEAKDAEDQVLEAKIKQEHLQQQQVNEIDAVNAVNRYRSKLYSNRKHELINYCVVLIALFALLISLLGFAYLSFQTNDGRVWDAPPPRANLEDELFRISGFK
jgi:hypothetical protein